ncbi:protein ALTERED PHOSPHATE STARVATION RESPONSE 1-like [Zingiber officinale]|uniref:protein ALTERED PHOSPHATE STARVATION RESPONSE 1-like n=1 Tax=Zingiber officinale TaxID=94328 RepID=UPI001C4C434B|nr:protein ALTERED PHOSPHATE STARVATION RESPONSE 1-like [Zingiber officinale]
MGCSESKVEEQRAVVLCHGRADILAAAIRHRNALASAHAAYSDCLLSVSVALHRFLLLLPPSSSSSSSSSSPVLSVPSRRESEPSPPPPAPAVSSARRSNPSAPIKFDTLDSDDEYEGVVDDGYYFHHQHPYEGPFRHVPSFESIYYARRQPAPYSVAYEQRPPSYETLQVDYFDPYSGFTSQENHPFPFPPGYYGSMGGSFNPNPASETMPPLVSRGSSSSRAPPPSPPRISTWDLLNPFSTDIYGHGYTPSRNSGEVRHEEGIPDLEEVDMEQKMVQEATYSNLSSTAVSSSATKNGAYTSIRASSAREDESRRSCRQLSKAGRSSNSDTSVIDKNVVAMEQRNAAASNNTRNALEVANAIKAQFQRASKSFRKLSELLEMANHQLHSKQSPHDGLLTPLNSIDDSVKGSMGLASILQKLYVWEKKLYNEVKSEERMRLLLSKSNKELRHLVEKAAEAHRIDTTRSWIDKLSMEIEIAIQVVTTVSKKIDAVRDEELWPQVTELVLGLVRMWSLLLKCHQVHCQAIAEVKGLDFIVSSGKLSSANADEILQLEMEMHKWSSNLPASINAQRNFAKALNGWLLLCLPHEHAETAPSPTRIGAPPVFVICNYWSQAMDRASECEVTNSLLTFADSLHQLWERLAVDQNDRMIAVRDREKLLRVIEKKRRAMHKEVKSLRKKLALVPGQITTPPHQKPDDAHNTTAEVVGSLESGLKNVFEAMEHFSASSVKAYGELLELCGEQKTDSAQNSHWNLI